jgi:hypothetical protein
LSNGDFGAVVDGVESAIIMRQMWFATSTGSY